MPGWLGCPRGVGPHGKEPPWVGLVQNVLGLGALPSLEPPPPGPPSKWVLLPAGSPFSELGQAILGGWSGHARDMKWGVSSPLAPGLALAMLPLGKAGVYGHCGLLCHSSVALPPRDPDAGPRSQSCLRWKRPQVCPASWFYVRQLRPGEREWTCTVEFSCVTPGRSKSLSGFSSWRGERTPHCLWFLMTNETVFKAPPGAL